MPLLGAIVNAAAVLAGGIIGLLIRAIGKKIGKNPIRSSTVSGRFQDIVMKGIGLCVAYIGIIALEATTPNDFI